MQICDMYKFSEEGLSLDVRGCQQQSNRVDCGDYAVANAFHLLFGGKYKRKENLRGSNDTSSVKMPEI